MLCMGIARGTVRTAMRITGHKDARMFQRYRIVPIDVIQGAMEKRKKHRGGGKRKKGQGPP